MSNERTARELEHARAVREMFSGIAGKYDFLNHFLSVNIDKRWRRKVSAKLKDVLENPEAIVLDVACGTGDLSLELKNAGKAKVIGTDFCRPMLAVAKEKTFKENQTIPYIEGDGMNLAFEDKIFDAVTIAFGLRNFSNWQDGLKELHRVLKTRRKNCDFRIFRARRSGFPAGISILFFARSAAHRRRGQRFARRV